MTTAPACTCFLGHLDHTEDCYCTTPVADCAVHGSSEIGEFERELAARYDAEQEQLARENAQQES